jgi:opine dehydrogenase
VTPSIADVIEVLDRERVSVAAALGIQACSAKDWLEAVYHATGENLHDALQNQWGYHGIKAPDTLSHRYIAEDVPMGLVPIAGLGQQYGVPVPAMDTIIRLAGIIHKTDYWLCGRRPEILGIARLSATELTRYVHDLSLKAAKPGVPALVN